MQIASPAALRSDAAPVTHQQRAPEQIRPHYRPLQGDELAFVLTRHWRQLGLSLEGADFTDAQASAAVARITGGNCRLLHRLFVQIERIVKINDLSVITDDVVEAALSTLVIGAT